MMTQGDSETRLHFLLRVASAFCKKAPDTTVDYDGTTCDGYCLSEELDAELQEWDDGA